MVKRIDWTTELLATVQVAGVALAQALIFVVRIKYEHSCHACRKCDDSPYG